MDFKNKKTLTVMINVFAIIPLIVLAKKAKDLEIITLYSPPDCGIKAEPGDEVHVHYTGALESGKVFDSSVQANREPLAFVLGEGKVIPGWEQGLNGMCVGEKRKLIIPSDLAYGDRGYPPAIPPKATLIFETELVDLKKVARETDNTIFQLLQFLSVPVGVCFLVYYIYNKYKEETAKDSVKPERRGKKKRQ